MPTFAPRHCLLHAAWTTFETSGDTCFHGSHTPIDQNNKLGMLTYCDLMPLLSVDIGCVIDTIVIVDDVLIVLEELC